MSTCGYLLVLRAEISLFLRFKDTFKPVNFILLLTKEKALLIIGM